MKTILYKFKDNLLKIFRGRNLLFHLLAIVLTYVLVISGFDWKYFVFFNGSALQSFLFSAVVLGGFLPIFLPIILYFLGRLEKSSSLRNAAYAVFQAVLLGSIISSFYKIFTGRLQPAFHSASLVDISRDFQFGFLRNGIYWGWPSSHATIAFAVATTLFVLYPKNLAVRILALLSAFYIGIGVSMSIHWFSDFISGAILGSLIGFIVGRAFLARLKPSGD